MNNNQAKQKTEVTLYTDGACSGNPGPGGYGAILVYTDSKGIKHEKELSAGYQLVTNNQMELLAVIAGFEALKKAAEVTVVSDSKYVCEAFNSNWIDNWVKKNWKNVKNDELWKRLLKSMQGHNAKFVWVKGHAGHPYNERCDKLAVNAYKQNVLLKSF